MDKGGSGRWKTDGAADPSPIANGTPGAGMLGAAVAVAGAAEMDEAMLLRRQDSVRLDGPGGVWVDCTIQRSLVAETQTRPGQRSQHARRVCSVV